MTVGIIGYGVVGQNMAKIFPEAHVVDQYVDKSRYPVFPSFAEAGEEYYDVAFICVPTDPLPDGSCDTSVVEKAIRENNARVFVVKSTVPPGTCHKLSVNISKRVVFSPEFFGGTHHANAVDYDFVILGGNRKSADIVAELYKEHFSASLRIFKTDTETAELVKYAENAFLATKVRFFAEFAGLVEHLGKDADEWRELLLNDPRIGRSHTFTYRDHPYYDSHCLNKDVPAILAYADSLGYEMPLLQRVGESNEIAKRKAVLEEIE